MAIIAQLSRGSVVLAGTAPASGNAYFELVSGALPAGWTLSEWSITPPVGARIRATMSVQGQGRAQIIPTGGSTITSAERDWPSEQIVFVAHGSGIRFRTPNTAEGTPFMVEVAIL